MASMSQVEFTLNPTNLNGIPFLKYPKDFTFIVNGKKYQTTRIVADILSPIIRKLHFIDESINEFSINIKNIFANETNNEDYFNQFLNLCSFETIKIDSNLKDIFSTYFFKLGNFDEYKKMNSKYLSNLTIENVLDHFDSIINLFEVNSYEINAQIQFFDEIILFISNHFEEIDKARLKKLPLLIIEEILKNPKLKVSDEDSLFEFVMDLYRSDRSYSILFEFIQFCNLSEKSIEIFINEFDIEHLNSKIWSRICSRLHSKVTPIEKAGIVKEFKYEKGKEFDGIINYLTKQTGGNIHDNGTVEITSNSIMEKYPKLYPKNVVVFDKEDGYLSKDYIDKPYICFDFKEKRVKLSEYSIKSTTSSNSHNAFLKNWAIEVSNDGQNFIEIDRRSNNSQLNAVNAVATFSIQNENNDFYRFIRLHTTGESWHNYYCCKMKFFIHSIEFFGKLQ